MQGLLETVDESIVLIDDLYQQNFEKQDGTAYRDLITRQR